MELALAELKERLGEIADLSVAEERPRLGPRGLDAAWRAGARASQLGTLQSVIHAREIDDRIGELLDALEPYAGSLDPDDDDACLVRVARRNWERKRRIPTALAAELASAEVDGYAAWLEAREANDFAVFRPQLERMLELKLRWVECYAPYDDPYDVLLDDYDEGLRASTVADVFDVLRPELSSARGGACGPAGRRRVPLARLPDRRPRTPSSRELVERFGATWDEFRLDVTVHPFAARFGQHDIRLTTAYEEHSLSSLFGAMHECGHGLYQWGSGPALDRTPLADGSSSSLHESQSRLWENAVGRSLPFWRWFYPSLQEAFPDQLGSVTLDRFYRAVNRVQRTFTRLDADETSYGLHVILRFELERKLVAGELAVSDLPDAWNSLLLRSCSGLEVPDDRQGVLQDVHWSVGLLGYFPTYLLGSVLSVQIWERAREALPDLDAEIERGDFSEPARLAAREPLRAREQAHACRDDRPRGRRADRPARRISTTSAPSSRSASRRARAPSPPRPRGSRGGAEVTRSSSRCCVMCAISSTARSKMAAFAADGFCMPLTLRTYWSAEARISSLGRRRLEVVKRFDVSAHGVPPLSGWLPSAPAAPGAGP